MRRLNVRFSQIEECIRTSLFAVDSLPREHPLEHGELLLLQLTKGDAAEHGKLGSRIEFALVFDRAVRDTDGSRSRKHWPNAGKVWPYILECSETIPTIPFSLERVGLGKDYAGQSNAVFIEPADEAIIRPYVTSGRSHAFLPAESTVHDLLTAIKNYDRVIRLSPVRTSKVDEHVRRLANPWLGNALKTLYDHKCQICVHTFQPRYGVPYADTRFVAPTDQPEQLASHNVVVLCPNHNAIIGAAGAKFERESLLFVFPNGLREQLTLRDHLIV
jgi:hypothetical protein